MERVGEGSPHRLSWRRRLALALLCGYVALLGMAAWEDPVRPGFLDLPFRAAHAILAVPGIRPGLAVFRAEETDDRRSQATCFAVRGRTASGERVRLHPPQPGCRISGFFTHFPFVDHALYLMGRQARTLQQTILKRPDSVDAAARRDALLARMGQHFCQRGAASAGSLRSISLLWYNHFVAYSSGETSAAAFLYMRHDCEPDRLAGSHWFPDAEEVERVWGSLPWE